MNIETIVREFTNSKEIREGLCPISRIFLEQHLVILMEQSLKLTTITRQSFSQFITDQQCDEITNKAADMFGEFINQGIYEEMRQIIHSVLDKK